MPSGLVEALQRSDFFLVRRRNVIQHGVAFRVVGALHAVGLSKRIDSAPLAGSC